MDGRKTAHTICYVTPLALPLGELSPQVTERASGANQDGCYGGIAAEIGTKNMPPACFINVPTLSVLAALGHLSQRERQEMLARRTKRCIEVHYESCLTNQMKQEQAQQIIPLCLLTVSCSPLIYFCSFKYDAKVRATSRLSLGGMYSNRA